MSAQIFLIAPADADVAEFPPQLGALLDAAPVAALLLQRGDLAEHAYKALVKSVAALAQPRGCAVLIEGEPGLVRTLGADGLHVAGGVSEVRDAIAALKPDLIVGAATDGTRHDAMEKGELGADYVMFGPLSGPIEDGVRDLGAWWAETMEIPSVLSDPEATAELLASEGCEFVAIGSSVWTSPDPAAAMAAIAERLQADA